MSRIKLQTAEKALARLAEELRTKIAGEVRVAESLAKHTSYQVGGAADFYVIPSSMEEVVEVLKFARRQALPLFTIGRGTNLLVSDAGFRGIVLDLCRVCKGLERDGQRIFAGAAVLLRDLIKYSVSQGLGGLEKLAGIPGTVGGALHMNAGAFGTEISDCLCEVELMDFSGRIFRRRKEEIPFGYRLGMTEPETIILGAEFLLEPADTTRLQTIVEEILAQRKQKQPLTRRSAGSVFKRPQGHYAGALIEACGCKNLKVGGAMVSRKHSNFIINRGNASAKDIFDLIQIVQQRVWEKFKIRLELELELVGWETIDH